MGDVAKVANSPRIKRLIEAKNSDAEMIDELYLATLSRSPTEEERRKALEYVLGTSKPAIEQAGAEKKAAEEALAKVQGDLAKAKAASEAKTALDKLAADEKAASASLTRANQKLDAANATHQKLRVPALQDVLWALLNTKEFMFNH